MPKGNVPTPTWLEELIKSGMGRNISVNSSKGEFWQNNSSRQKQNVQNKPKSYERYDAKKREFWFTFGTVNKLKGIQNGNTISWVCGKDAFIYEVSIENKDRPTTLVSDHSKVGYAKVLKATHNGEVFYVAPKDPIAIAII